jgi:hypothetical protein
MAAYFSHYYCFISDAMSITERYFTSLSIQFAPGRSHTDGLPALFLVMI